MVPVVDLTEEKQQRRREEERRKESDASIRAYRLRWAEILLTQTMAAVMLFGVTGFVFKAK